MKPHTIDDSTVMDWIQEVKALREIGDHENADRCERILREKRPFYYALDQGAHFDHETFGLEKITEPDGTTHYKKLPHKC